MKKIIFLIILCIFLVSCASNKCLIEKKEYSCAGFEVKGTIYEDKSIIIYNMTYLSEGLSINGIMAKPKQDKKSSLIIFNHGGKEGIEELNWIKRLASRGYTILASHYRGEGGSEGNIEVALGETTDVMNLLECGKQLSTVDEKNIGIIGFSHGGAITVQAMELTEDFKAGVALWGPMDILKRVQNIKSADDPVLNWVKTVETPDNKAELTKSLLKRSPIYCVDKLNAPLLIFHGQLDKLIPYEYALDFVETLDKFKKDYLFFSLENLGHEFERADGTKDTLKEEEAMVIVTDWFDKYLK